MSIASARSRPIGSIVAVAGVVTAEAGRLGTPVLIAIQDASGGIVVKLPDEAPRPARGARIEVRGPLADPYGQLELRPVAADVEVGAGLALPEPSAIDGSLGETVEGNLVVVTGVAAGRPPKSTSGDISFVVEGPAGPIRIAADASSGLTPDSITAGATYRVVGIAGQRASRKGVLDGYRVWPRDARDITRLADPSPSGQPGASPSPGASGNAASARAIADAIRQGSGDVTVEGIVTTTSTLLDSSRRRIVIEDRTAGVEILLPVDASAPAVGARIRVSGEIGRAYDAPRLKARSVAVLAVGGRPLPLLISHPPTAAHEWRLVRVTGTIVDVAKLGDRWRAELAVGSERIAIGGLAGAGIPVTALAEGRRATVTGIARRPYPGASDRRWTIVPRSIADLDVAGGAGAGRGTSGAADDPSAGPGAAGSGEPASDGRPDVDLARLADHVGQTVRVGGLVTELFGDGFGLDDGTAIGRVVLAGDAAGYLPLLEPGDALNATGRVDEGVDGFVVTVEDPAGLVRVGDPGALETLSGAGSDTPSAAASAPEAGPSLRAGDLFGVGGFGAAGILGTALLTLASVAVTLLRRRRARRLLAARIAARVASVGGPPGRHA